MTDLGSHPRADTLASLCEVLQVSADWLLFGDGSVRAAGPTEATGELVFQPACRPGGSDKTGRHLSVDGRVTLNITVTVKVGTAAKIMALLEEDQG